MRDILSVPMQRILKYHLLLDKLVKETTPVNKYKLINKNSSMILYAQVNVTYFWCVFVNLAQAHDDYRGLERAKEAMVDVAQYTNEVKRDSEHLVVIQKVKVHLRW